MNFDPTPTTGVQWLDLAARLQLDRDLTDLPDLADQLDRHYNDLLARGDRNPDDPAIRYPIRPDVLDLADRRTKWEHTATRTEPLTLTDRGIAGPTADPQWWADMARRIGARRQGILPTLASWVSLAAGEMHDTGQWHIPPTDPALIVWVATTTGEIRPSLPGPSVTSEAGWLRRHLDWIADQAWVIELAGEVRDIVNGLANLGITLDGPNPQACLTADQIADNHPVSRATVYRWWNAGLLSDVGKRDRKRVFVVHEVEALIALPPWERGDWKPCPIELADTPNHTGVVDPRQPPVSYSS